MTDKVTDIPLKLVIVERNYGNWKEFKIATTPVNIEALLGPIYQLKAGATLHRMLVKKRAVTAKVLVGEDAIVVKESEEVIEYVNKTDLEPYELSNYDKERLDEYNKRVNAKNMFDTMIMPSIKSISEKYDLKWTKDRNNILLTDMAAYYDSYSFPYCKADHKEKHNEIVDKLKALGCKVSVAYYGNTICKINITQTIANAGLI